MTIIVIIGIVVLAAIQSPHQLSLFVAFATNRSRLHWPLSGPNDQKERGASKLVRLHQTRIQVVVTKINNNNNNNLTRVSRLLALRQLPTTNSWHGLHNYNNFDKTEHEHWSIPGGGRAHHQPKNIQKSNFISGSIQ